MSQVLIAPPDKILSLRLQQAVGSLGALLALVILGASILLRLTTHMTDDGTVHSTLPTATENAVRMVHRLTASGVGLLALLATVLCWMQRRVAPQTVKPVVWLVLVTVVLAVIGPLTPGYRYTLVTVTNVVGGTVLLGACWWLREALSSGATPHPTEPHRLLRVTLVILAVHVALGATASGLEMRGIHWVVFVHTGSALLTTLLLGSILWDRRKHAPLHTLVAAMTAILSLQIMLGMVALWVHGRPVAVGFVHAMLSPLLVAGLVSIAIRDRTSPATIPAYNQPEN